MSFQQEAEQLVRQLRSEGIQDERVLEAIRQTPRERFVPPSLISRAYENNALPIGSEQTISQPYIVALMTEALQLTGTETVLEIGTGSGYQAAVLAHLCQQVVTVERIEELALSARKLLTELGYTNIEFHSGDGAQGWESHAPYEAIIVTACAASLPEALLNQLADGGRMVIPVGVEPVQIMYRLTRQGEQIRKEELCRCRFVPLITEN
ncbi:MAG: protein-L-isoaspartate(D-aspartate) O-methyltransferase [Planctomycetaceae bacterium]|nr:protein-L-isoaspartate(D-aspartate) O-methyltransferase [Planctomycetaceae bacterium]